MPERAKAVLKFFDWAYKNGGKMAKELDYVPLPDNVVKLVEKTWARDHRRRTASRSGRRRADIVSDVPVARSAGWARLPAAPPSR